jgi:hypothetical protein
LGTGGRLNHADLENRCLTPGLVSSERGSQALEPEVELVVRRCEREAGPAGAATAEAFARCERDAVLLE